MKKNAFLLFEVMVAIVVASTVLVVVLQGLGNALRAGAVGENYFKAKLLAEGKIALLEKELAVKAGTESGRFSRAEDPERIFTWKQEINELIIGKMRESKLPINEAKVTVGWQSSRGNRNVVLVTYVPREEEGAGLGLR